CPGQRQVFTGAPVQLGHPFTPDRIRFLGPAPVPVENGRERLLELLPFLFVQFFEMQRVHARRPNNHCETPSTRRVTSACGSRASPCTETASAASSSRRSM